MELDTLIEGTDIDRSMKQRVAPDYSGMYGHNIIYDMENNFAFWPDPWCLRLYKVMCIAIRATKQGHKNTETRALQLLIKLYEDNGGTHPAQGYYLGDGNT